MQNRKIDIVKMFSLVIALVLLLAACGTRADTPADSTAAGSQSVTASQASDEGQETGDKLKIAIAINDMDAFQVKQVECYQALCDQKGYEFIYTNAGNNIEKQVADVESLIVQQPDVLGIQAVDSAALADVAEQAIVQGIPVASIYYGLASDKCVTIGSDLYVRGYSQGELVVDFLEANPDVILKTGYIWGSKSMDITSVIYQGFLDATQGYEDRFIILDEQDAEWSAEKSMNIMENWLQSYPEMNCVVAQADQMIAGAASALKGAGVELDNWYAFGQDIKQEAVPLMQEGIMVGSVYMDIPKATEYIISTLEGMAGGTVQPGDEVDMEIYALITADNLDDYIDVIP